MTYLYEIKSVNDERTLIASDVANSTVNFSCACMHIPPKKYIIFFNQILQFIMGWDRNRSKFKLKINIFILCPT